MNKVDKKRKPRKELPIVVNLIFILIFSGIFVCFGICIGFLINAFINYSTDDIIANTVLTLLVGIVYITILLILIRNRDSQNIKPFKWYINCLLISLTFTFVITALTVFTLGSQEDNIINYLIGVCMFPLIGIITTPNIVKHVINDTSRWKKIFYKNGNLHKFKDSKDYYRVQTPVSYEKKILSQVYKEQFKNILVVIGIMVVVITFCIYRIMTGYSYSDNLLMNLLEVRAKRSFGFIFFLTIFFFAFGIPIIVYYLSNALKKIRVVKNHEYIAYHAIVPSVHMGKIGIYDKKKYYKYKYCTCVGIKEKKVNFTNATLIFIPDDVLLFPDNEDNKESV